VTNDAVHSTVTLSFILILKFKIEQNSKFAAFIIVNKITVTPT